MIIISISPTGFEQVNVNTICQALNDAGIHEPDWMKIGVAVLNKPLHVSEFYENWSRTSHPSWKALAGALEQIRNFQAATTARQQEGNL